MWPEASQEQKMRIICGGFWTIQCFSIRTVIRITYMLNSEQFFADPTESFSKYICSQNTYQLASQDQSHCSQTLLIETTPITQKAQQCQSSAESKKLSSIFYRNNPNSHFIDINEEFQITMHEQHTDKSTHSRANKSLEELYDYLISTIKGLQTKIEHLQENQKGSRKLCLLKEPEKIIMEKVLAALLNCNSLEHNKEPNQWLLNYLAHKNRAQASVEAIQNKTKATVYCQQMEKAQTQCRKALLMNEQLKKQIKKLKAENQKFRELIKQYQIYNRKKHQIVSPIFQSESSLQSAQISQFISRISSQVSKRFNLETKRIKNRPGQLLEGNRNGLRISKEDEGRIQASLLFHKQTPKTPQQMPLGKLNKNYEKTQPKMGHRSCDGLLKKIIEFQQKNQSEFRERLYRGNVIPERGRREKPIRKSAQHFNPLVRCQYYSKQDFSNNSVSLANFETMKSLQEVLEEHQSFYRPGKLDLSILSQLHLQKAANQKYQY